MCLVDTPGLGSVFAGNTAATQAFVPHIDAAIIVIGTDPPLSGEELELVKTVSHDVHERNFARRPNDSLNLPMNSYIAWEKQTCLGWKNSPRILVLTRGLRSQFYFHIIERVAAPASPLLFIADLLLGGMGLRGGIVRDA
jgi:hypothetical protein